LHVLITTQLKWTETIGGHGTSPKIGLSDICAVDLAIDLAIDWSAGLAVNLTIELTVDGAVDLTVWLLLLKFSFASSPLETSTALQ